jgi:hypothetical protein
MPSYASWEYASTIHPRPTIQAAAGEYAVVRSCQPHYEGTTAGNVRAFVQRYNSAGVTPTARTGNFNTGSPAARVPGQTWATGPAAVGNPLLVTDSGDRVGGLGNRWTPARPYAGIYLVDADEVGTDDTTSTSATVGHYISWAEHDPGLEGRSIRGRRPRTKYWHHGAYRSGSNALLSSGRNRRNWICFETRRFAKYFINPNDDALQLLGGGGGPTTFNQALSASIAITASLVKTVNKNVVANVTLSATIAKLINKALSATVTTSAAITKLVNKSLSATVTTSAAIIKLVNKVLSAPITLTATLQATKAIIVNLVATVTASASMTRVVNKALSAPVTAAATVVKLVNKKLSAPITLTASVVRVINKQLSAPVTATASIAKVLSVKLVATVTVVANLTTTFVAGTVAVTHRAIKWFMSRPGWY